MGKMEPERDEQVRKTLEEHRTWLFKLLTRRPYSRLEVKKRLLERGLKEEETEALTHDFQAMQLLSDRDYARLFAEGHEAWGRKRIAFELERRGVGDEDIQEALAEVDDLERAQSLVKTWQASGVASNKMENRLYRRGFDYPTIRSVCREEDELSW